jgi:integrase
MVFNMASVQSRVFNGVVRYRVRFRSPDGKQRSKSFGSMREARAFASKVETQVREGDWIDPNAGRETFGELHSRWVAARVVSPVRAATEETQANVHILPRWRNVPLKKIKPLDVQEWIKNLTSPRLDAEGNRKPASAYTAEGGLLQFRQVLDAAVLEGIIRTNPAAKVKSPPRPRKRVTKADVLEIHELDALVSAMPDRYKALVYLLGWLGMRWSEAMGLRNRHVDLQNACIYVGEEVAVQVRGTIHRRAGGKTAAATRTVPLPGPALDALRWHVDAAFNGDGPDGSVFVTEGGKTPDRSNFHRVFNKAVNDCGLSGRGINLRQLRHTAATLMLSSGLDILDVQERLGHSRGSITLDIYGRVLAGRRSEGTEIMSSAMKQSQCVFETERSA